MCETNSKARAGTAMVSASGKFLSRVLRLKCYVPSDLKYGVSLESIMKHYHKIATICLHTYLESIPGGSDLEKMVKKYKQAVKSHWRISEQN